MKKADDDDDNNDNDDDSHQGWIIVRDGMYSVADKKCSTQHWPRWWFSKDLTGEVANLRSQSWMTGEWSSSEASAIWVATSGCQHTCAQRSRDTESLTWIKNIADICFVVLLDMTQNKNHQMHPSIIMCNYYTVFLLVKTRRTLIIGSFFLKSQTMQRLAKVLAKMCWTCEFHATDVTSSAGWKREGEILYILIQKA